jgi:hypothetical protein
LTIDEVREIRRLSSEESWSEDDLADVYCVSKRTISRILKRLIWTHVDTSIMQPQNVASLSTNGVEYRSIVGETNCLVGDDGSVWTLWRNLGKGKRRGHRFISDTWEPLGVLTSIRGYRYVTLPSGRRVKVGWIVLEAFVGPRPANMECLHGNDVKDDDRLTNLRWGTRQDNSLDASKNGLLGTGSSLGSDNGNSFLNEDEVRAVRRLYRDEDWSGDDIANLYCVSKVSIYNIINGRTWAHIN